MRRGLLLAALVWPYAAAAQNEPAAEADVLRRALGHCKSLPAEQQLACFHKLAEEAPTAPLESVSDIGWTVKEEVDKLDGSKRIGAVLLSADADEGKHATLLVRCLKGKTESYISWPHYLGSEIVVKWRVDGGPIKTENWRPSTDGRAAFTPAPIQFLTALFGKAELVVNMKPYNRVDSTLTFKLGDTETAIRPLSEACRWGEKPSAAPRPQAKPTPTAPKTAEPTAGPPSVSPIRPPKSAPQ